MRKISECGFHAVAFFNRFHPEPHEVKNGENFQAEDARGWEGMFRFEKQMK